MIITNLLIMMNIMLMLISQEFFQVLSNLINNAIKFTDRSGVISISLDKAKSPSSDKNNSLEENEYTLIRIKDYGRGINPDVQSRLFSKFATKSDIETGLGLFIARSIVEAHMGWIWARIIQMEKVLLFHLH